MARRGARPNGYTEYHRMSRTAMYRMWRNMLTRCYNEKATKYKNYGGRGIKVCDRWKNSFNTFLSDMGFPPSDKHTIDREDTNKDYTPENCRWVTQSRQCRNRVNTKMYTYNGETKCLPDWADIIGIPLATLRDRINNQKWSVERAFTTPLAWRGQRNYNSYDEEWILKLLDGSDEE